MKADPGGQHNREALNRTCSRCMIFDNTHSLKCRTPDLCREFRHQADFGM